jgi:hypothetical protein
MFGRITAKEVSEIEKYFKQFKVDELPKEKRPLYKVGDLLETFVNSGNYSDSFYIKSGLGVVVEISFYECTDYNYDNESRPWYIIEYKLLMTPENCYRYFSEDFLELPKGKET